MIRDVDEEDIDAVHSKTLCQSTSEFEQKYALNRIKSQKRYKNT